MKFSERLLQFRREQGLSQEALAEKIGVSRQAVSKWETGEALPDLQKAMLLSEALGVSLDSLCGKDVPPPAADTPQPRRRTALSIALSAIFLCLGFLLGGLIFGLRPEPPAMPETVTISNVSTWLPDENGPLNYQFIPSVAGADYTYRIIFTTRAETIGSDAVYSDGICTGTVELPAYVSPRPNSFIQYQVAVIVSNGVEERTVPIGSLTLFYDEMKWYPST